MIEILTAGVDGGNFSDYIKGRFCRAISSAWLECLRDMQEVGGSTPLSPTQISPLVGNPAGGFVVFGGVALTSANILVYYKSWVKSRWNNLP